MRTEVDNLKRATGIRKGVVWAIGIALVTASSVCVLLAGPLAVYPRAKLDQDFERTHLRLPTIDTKQYFTSDSFDTVVAYYKTLTPASPQNAIDSKTRRRLSFREKGDEKNVSTVEWSNEAGEDSTKTFIFVNTAK
jgi:hypothetical protein